MRTGAWGNNWSDVIQVNFNASNSNSIYGAAETVQPPTLNLICQSRF